MKPCTAHSMDTFTYTPAYVCIYMHIHTHVRTYSTMITLGVRLLRPCAGDNLCIPMAYLKQKRILSDSLDRLDEEG